MNNYACVIKIFFESQKLPVAIVDTWLEYNL